MKKLNLISTSLFTLGILCAGVNSAIAQDAGKKLSFGLNIGAGIPMGGYGKADSSAFPLASGKSGDTTKYDGFAKTGFHFDVTATYMFTPVVGAMISLGGTMNSYDIATFNSLLISQNNGGDVPAFAASGSYFVGQYLIGPYIVLPLGGDKLKLEFKGLVGLLDASYPNLSYSNSEYGYTETGSVVVKGGSGFGYSIGAGLKYMLTDNIGLHFNVSYVGSSVTYSSFTETESISGGGSSQSYTYSDPASKTMSVGLLQITVGGSIDL